MSDWKTLDKGDLPSDILVGDYEFAINGMVLKNRTFPETIDDLLRGCLIEYRLYQEAPVSDEEIIGLLGKQQLPPA